MSVWNFVQPRPTNREASIRLDLTTAQTTEVSDAASSDAVDQPSARGGGSVGVVPTPTKMEVAADRDVAVGKKGPAGFPGRVMAPQHDVQPLAPPQQAGQSAPQSPL
jgi:hypothetical protein